MNLCQVKTLVKALGDLKKNKDAGGVVAMLQLTKAIRELGGEVGITLQVVGAMQESIVLGDKSRWYMEGCNADGREDAIVEVCWSEIRHVCRTLLDGALKNLFLETQAVAVLARVVGQADAHSHLKQIAYAAELGWGEGCATSWHRIPEPDEFEALLNIPGYEPLRAKGSSLDTAVAALARAVTDAIHEDTRNVSSATSSWTTSI